MRRTDAPMPKYQDRVSRPGTRPHAIHHPSKDGKEFGVPKWLRRYCKRYGSDLLSMRKLDLQMKHRPTK